MLLRPHLRWGLPCVTALGIVLIAGWANLQPEQVLQAQLFKQVDKQRSRELFSGDSLAEEDKLYMIVETRHSLHVYVISENATKERLIIYPCQAWGRSPRLPPDQPRWLPGYRNYWIVESVTSRERLLVIASTRPIDLLDAAFVTEVDPKRCAAPVGDEASRWIDGLVDPPSGFAKLLWKARARKSGTWLSVFDLKSIDGHG